MQSGEAHRVRGEAFESLALDFLKSKGLRLVERNFHCRHGEIDLVMMDNRDLVFVEVRFRKNPRFGGAAQSISIHKQKKIRITAERFLQLNAKLGFQGCRFDVLAIDGVGPTQKIDWILDAF